jgi:hypothetical protein
VSDAAGSADFGSEGGEVSGDFHGETVVADGGAWLGASAPYLG